MNPFALLIVAGLGVAAYALSRTGNILLKLSLDIKNARVHKVQIDYSTVKFDLVIQNPTKRDAVIQGYDVSLVYNNKVIATLNKERMSAPIKAQNTTTLKDITAKINSLGIVDNLLDLFLGNYSDFITIKGDVQADGIQFPFSKQIQLVNPKQS